MCKNDIPRPVQTLLTSPVIAFGAGKRLIRSGNAPEMVAAIQISVRTPTQTSPAAGSFSTAPTPFEPKSKAGSINCKCVEMEGAIYDF